MRAVCQTRVTESGGDEAVAVAVCLPACLPGARPCRPPGPTASDVMQPGGRVTTRPGSIWSTSTTTSSRRWRPSRARASTSASRNTASRRSRGSASATASSCRSGKRPAAGCSARRRPTRCRPARAASRSPSRWSAATARISVPFAGRIAVAGRLPLEVQRTIEQRLADKAIEPQVIVTIIEERHQQRHRRPARSSPARGCRCRSRATGCST